MPRVKPPKCDCGFGRYTLTVDEVAEALGISPDTVVRGVDAGTIPGWREGRRVLVTAPALLKQMLLTLGDPKAIQEAADEAKAELEAAEATARENRKALAGRQALMEMEAAQLGLALNRGRYVA